MSKQIDLGPVAIVPKGNWDANTTYEKLNLVYYSDATYICKVNSSTGVVPSPTSSDWMQVVKSMSAVSSVNGLTGNVIVDSVDTPASNDISTKIANTEWVTNKTNTVLANAKSYTDSGIANASEAIRKTVAADTKTSIEVAIDSHMQASRNEFASKTAIADMATNAAVSTTYATKAELSTEIQTLTASTAADIDAVEKTITDTAASIKTTTDKLAQDITDNNAVASNTYATKQSVTDLSTSISNTYLNKTDAATTYITPSEVDAKISTLDGKLTNNISTAQSTADTASTTATEALTAANTKISTSGNRGALSGYEISGTSITIDENSTDANEVSAAITVNNGTVGTSWTKIVHNTAVITATLGDKWSWVNATTPKITADGIFVFCWCGSKGLANYVSAIEV